MEKRSPHSFALLCEGSKPIICYFPSSFMQMHFWNILVQQPIRLSFSEVDGTITFPSASKRQEALVLLKELEEGWKLAD